VTKNNTRTTGVALTDVFWVIKKCHSSSKAT